MATVKKVCVIGAGVSGLSAIKACLEEGFQPTCYEQHDDIGGIWYYTEDPRPNQGAAGFESLLSNLSKNMVCYSDFPFPEDAPMYPTHKRMHQYLHEYANHFGLLPYIRLGTQVIKVEQAKDHVTSGKWVVYTAGKKKKHETFDAVMISNGSAFARPVQPDVPGYESFKGMKLHSYSYRTNKPFVDKRVLIVGSGSTAFDLAIDVCRVATQVHLALLQGTWLFPRLHKGGAPSDEHLYRRVYSDSPVLWFNSKLKGVANNRLDHYKYGIAGTTEPLARVVPVVSDEIGLCLASQKIVIKPQLMELSATSARFADGTTLEDTDAIIFATGYDICCNFLDQRLEADIRNLDIYKFVFPTKLAHHTLAVIGAGQSNGPIFPILELQSRWAVSVFKGTSKLPDSATMSKDAQAHKDWLITAFGHPKPVRNNIPYRDDLATQIGARPNLVWLFLKDPLLAYLYYFGPAYPYHHRLVGPHAWEGAAAATKDAYYNTLSSVRTSFTPRDTDWSKTYILGTCLLLGVVSAMIILTWL